MHFIIILSQIKYYEAKLLWTLKQENLLLKSKPVRKYIPDKLDKKAIFILFCQVQNYVKNIKPNTFAD